MTENAPAEQSSEDIQMFRSPDSQPIGSKGKVISLLKRTLNDVQLHYHEFLAELAYLQGGGLLNEFEQWRRTRPQDLIHALMSGHLDADDVNKIGAFMSGSIPMHEIFPVQISTSQGDDMDEDSDEDLDKALDESTISILVRREVETLKRVLELKKKGLWAPDAEERHRSSESKPSFSSLAPPPELTRPKDHMDYLFAELRWLAEDFKKERHWKKMTAKKLAYAALKVYKEKTERSLKAEREETLRIRKQCALIARMVRDWWRQMDKIVQTKQKARLTARHQQAMTTHLGHVIETTERYTMWLTEGIVGSKDKATAGDQESLEDTEAEESAKDAPSNKESDAEFVADEDSTDDEETIAKEEELVHQDEKAKEEESKEIEALCAEAEASIDELLPPGYLEHLQKLQEAGKLDENAVDHEDEGAASEAGTTTEGNKSSHMRKRRASSDGNERPERPKSKRRRDSSFDADAETSDDDETTIAEQEKHEKVTAGDGSDHEKDTGPSAMESKEVNELEAEADMSIEELLARYGLNPDQLKSGNVASPSRREDEDTSTNDEEESSDEADSSSSSSSEDADNESEDVSDDDNEEENEEAGLLDLLSDDEKENLKKRNESVADSDMPENAELKAITDVAMSAQPTGNTLASVTEPVKTPFLLSGTLREYQVVGLSWLVAIYEKRLNGILADEMGLGKTIQTIALLAHLACELGIWGPHLIVVPNSVILNWEVEFKKWCPGFKILTYFGSVKERRAKRKGWTKTNAFHVCITSYRLAIQDSSAFKRKKWKYLILDEAQNIKNFKSQRWQTLLTFNSQRRLLLTGTPLQNSLMELWSLMHFLMPNIFQSHREFQEWFASPLTGMIEGNSEYNEQLVIRLHKVLRPFLLRRLKEDVEKQMPKKYEHVILCRLSKRQRYLYDDFMSLSTTKDTLASGQFLSVMNILMQLRKVCNHPNLFEPRPITSPFHVADDDAVRLELPRLVARASQPHLVAFGDDGGGDSLLADWLDRAGAAARLIGQTANLAEMARDLPSFVASRVHQLQAKPKLITELDTREVVDSVSRQREFFAELKKSMDMEEPQSAIRRRLPPIFIPRSVVLEVNEELAKSMEGYYPSTKSKLPFPSLPQPHVEGTSYIPIDCPLNPWDTGVPKSVLRSRHTERQQRLRLLARVNERRCANPFTSSPSFKTTSIPTPDLVYWLTARVLRQPLRPKPEHRFGTGAWVVCQRALRTWPDRRACEEADGPPAYLRRPIDVASGLAMPGLQPVDVERTTAFFGPEAAFSVRQPTPKALRQMLFSPADCLEYFVDDLDKFLITTPPAICSGVRLHTSCAAVHRAEMQQEAVFERALQPFLAAAGVFRHCDALAGASASKKGQAATATGTGRSKCNCKSLTYRSWLMPSQLHRVCNSHAFQFPDPRLIQYDCGKLQRLDLLLRELYADEHRVLIFTQMARMLDILEQFLAYHGYRYLRLDGTTKVEQRQVLMERFNMDSRIFVFILSTRSGGLGVNLTGADTVIFYDSDWNPTMDAQAQDRCHRIGQTRDVHIYRLISERTVEENILRKANQKRLLSDVAIEGGKFTTAFFKQSIISDLFAEPSGLQDLVQEKEDRETEKATKATDEDTEGGESSSNPPSPPLLTTRSGRQIRWKGATSILLNAKQQSGTESSGVGTSGAAITDSQWVAALEACEDDENDRVAAKRALDEAKADMEEFDETKPIPVAPGEGDEKTAIGNAEGGGDDEAPTIEGSASDPLARFVKKRQQEAAAAAAATVQETNETDPEAMVERELAEFESLLRPIERFGVNHLESFQDDTLNLELEQFEAQIEESKKEWKLKTLLALHEADEERAELEEDEMLYCDPDYDPEAARLAELDQLARAEELEREMLADPNAAGYRGRGRGRGRGGPRIRGRGRGAAGASGTPRSDTKPSETEEMESPNRFSTAWRFRDGKRRRAAAMFDYSDLREPDDDELEDEEEEGDEMRYRRSVRDGLVEEEDFDDEDEAEARDIWSPRGSGMARRGRGSRGGKFASPTPLRGRGRGRGRGGRGRGRPRMEEYWRSQEEEEDEMDDEFEPPRRRRRLSSSSNFFVDDGSRTGESPSSLSMKSEASSFMRAMMVKDGNNAFRPRQRGRGSMSQTRLSRGRGGTLDFVRPSARMVPTIIRSSATRQYYGAYSRPYSPPNSIVTASPSYTPSFSGPIGLRQPNATISTNGMLQHNSRVLSSLMQQNISGSGMDNSADEATMSSPSTTTIFRQPFLSSRDEDFYPNRFQQQTVVYRPRMRDQLPRARVTFVQPRMQTTFIRAPVRAVNIAPPRRYTPPTTTASANSSQEPTTAVQTLSNGVRSVQPLQQVLSGASPRPVFVITRQVTTPSGEVIQQRITQPLPPRSPPPTKFVQVVRRINQPSSAGASTNATMSLSAGSPQQVIRVVSPGVSPTPQVAATIVQPGRKIIRVIRSTAPNAIRLLPPPASAAQNTPTAPPSQ